MEATQQLPGAPVTLRATFRIGGHDNRTQAEQDAKQFMQANVFEYRSAIFPNPKNYRLKLAPVSSTVKAWPAPPPSPLNTLYIEYLVDVTGAETQVRGWVAAVEKCLKAHAPSAYGATTARAKHLAETGRKAIGQGVAMPRDGLGMGGDRAKHLYERGIQAPRKEGSKNA